MGSPFLKDASEGASAIEAGREFHRGIVRGKKLYLKESVDVDICLNFLEWAALVLDVEGVRYLAAGMSIRSSTTLYRRLSCIFARLVSKVSHFRWSSMEITLLVFPYLFVAKRAARC